MPAPPLSPVVSRSTKDRRQRGLARHAVGLRTARAPTPRESSARVERRAAWPARSHVADADRRRESGRRLVAAIDDQALSERRGDDGARRARRRRASESMLRLVAAGVGLVRQLADGASGRRPDDRAEPRREIHPGRRRRPARAAVEDAERDTLRHAARCCPSGRRTTGSRTRTDSRRSARACARAAARASRTAAR